MYCARCGAELPEGTRFCGRCGAEDTGGASFDNDAWPVGKRPPISAAPEGSAWSNAQTGLHDTLPVASAAQTAPAAAPATPAASVPENRVLLIVATVALVVAVIALVVVVLGTRGQKPATSDYGTTLSNLLNGGFYARVGDTVYYAPDENLSGMDGYLISTIRRVNVDGSDEQLVLDTNEVLDNPANHIGCLMVDAANNRLLFAARIHAGSYAIMSVPLDGSASKPTELVSFSMPIPVPFVQIDAGKLYFDDNGTLYSIGLDGSGRTRVLDVHDARRWFVADGYVYTIPGDYKAIDRVPIGGGTSERVLTFVDAGYDVQVYGGKLYYMRSAGSSAFDSTDLVRFDIDSGEEAVLLHVDGKSEVSFTVDALGVTALVRVNETSVVYSCELGADALSKVFTYDGSLVGEEVEYNVSAHDDARLRMYGAVGDRVFFLPRKFDFSKYYGEGTANTQKEFFAKAWLTYCSVKRDGTGFATLGTVKNWTEREGSGAEAPSAQVEPTV